MESTLLDTLRDHQSCASEGAELEDNSARVAAAAAPAAGPAGSAASSRAADPVTAFSDADRALARLHRLALPLAAGAVTHMFTPETMLAALRLKSKLKPSSSMRDAIAATAPLLFGDAASHFARELHGVTLPSDDRMLEATVRLQLLATLWGQE